RGRSFDAACCLYPTAPFVTAEKLKAAYEKLQETGVDTVFPIMPFSYPVFRALGMENGKLKMIWNQYRNTRSQDLPEAYHDAGQFYFFQVENFMKKKSLITDNVAGIAISELEGQDIDNLTDWRLAELKFELLQNTQG
ncbi:MAG TPA: pseudaminic acid cytidylyltransferase, partial [Chitinophagaceae bacterium]|nr:pseudaminic acid cytidylyltransferase [Chitinophagaceae bacterium]